MNCKEIVSNRSKKLIDDWVTPEQMVKPNVAVKKK